MNPDQNHNPQQAPNPYSPGTNPYPGTQQPDNNWQRPVEPVLPQVQMPPQQQQRQDTYAPTDYRPTNYGDSPRPAQSQPSPYVPKPAEKPAPSIRDHSKERKFQHLNLSKGEVVLAEVRRHPIGVLQIYAVATVVLLMLLFGGGFLVRWLSQNSGAEGIVGGSAFPFPTELVTGLIFGMALLTVVIAAIAIHVYNGNRLYLTNEAVIQRIQTSLFHTKEQQIGLANVEDVSYEQQGLFPHLFNYGAIRLSTEGEETTYYFRYAIHPKEQAAKITNAQEEFNRINPEPHN